MNTRKLLILVFLLAAVLRFWGIWHGYPYSYYPDEAHFVKRALSFGSFDFNPHWFHKPAFYMYFLFFEYGIFFLLGKLIGFWNSITDFAVLYIKNPGAFYIIGRLTTALFSLGTIWIVYILGERHFKKGAGIIAALFLSLCYGAVVSSQEVKADTPAAFFTVLSMFFLLNFIEKHKLKDLIWSAGFAGVGTATKAYPIVMLVPIFVGMITVQRNTLVHLNQQIRKSILLALLIIFVFYTFFFICAPYNFIDPLGQKATFDKLLSLVGKFYSIFNGDNTVLPTDFITQPMSLHSGAIDYVRTLIDTNGMGLLIAATSFSGVVYLFFNLNKKKLIFLLFPLLFASISIFLHPGYAQSRHQLTLYPFLVIAGAALIVEISEKKFINKKAVIVFLIFLLCQPVYKIAERGLFISKEDTRNIAKTWIESNIPAGTKILVDENGPQLMLNEESLMVMLKKAEKADSKGQFTSHLDTFLKYAILAAKDSVTYDLSEIRFPWWRESEIRPGIIELSSDYDKDIGNPLRLVGVEDYRYYKNSGFGYAIVHSHKFERFLKDTTVAKNFPSFTNFYRELFIEGNLIKEFLPQDGNRPGPTVKIFEFR